MNPQLTPTTKHRMTLKDLSKFIKLPLRGTYLVSIMLCNFNSYISLSDLIRNFHPFIFIFAFTCIWNLTFHGRFAIDVWFFATVSKQCRPMLTTSQAFSSIKLLTAEKKFYACFLLCTSAYRVKVLVYMNEYFLNKCYKYDCNSDIPR